MVAPTDPGSLPCRGGVWLTGAGLLVAGMGVSVVALFLPTEPARTDGLPTWVWLAVAGLVVTGVRVGMLAWRSARLESPRTNPVWWRVARSHARWWRIALGVGAAGVGAWAVLACVADIRGGMPGSALPWLAVGCVALLVAAVLLSVSAPVWRGSVVRQALPAAIALVTVVAAAVTVDMVGWRIPVDATTAEPADRDGVPDLPRGVRWTSTIPTTWRTEKLPATGEVVAAGAGLVVASGDRVVALDGSTGTERWHYRRAGASIVDLTASPSGRTVLADFTTGEGRFSPSELFAFDADTGELRWSQRDAGAGEVTDHVFVEAISGGLVGVDLDSGEEVWTWTPPADCERQGPFERGAVIVLVLVTCRDRDGHRVPAVIGVEDRTGTEAWRYTGPPDPLHGELTAAPDGSAAWYDSPASTGSVLLDPNTGEVLYRSPGGMYVMGSDGRYSAVLRRFDPKGDRLVLRNLVTGAEHSLPSTCSAFGPADRARQTVVTPGTDRGPGSVLTLCFGSDGHAARANVDVYSADGTRLSTIEVGEIRDLSVSEELIAADGAIVLVVVSRDVRSGSTVVGLG